MKPKGGKDYRPMLVGHLKNEAAGDVNMPP